MPTNVKEQPSYLVVWRRFWSIMRYAWRAVGAMTHAWSISNHNFGWMHHSRTLSFIMRNSSNIWMNCCCAFARTHRVHVLRWSSSMSFVNSIFTFLECNAVMWSYTHSFRRWTFIGDVQNNRSKFLENGSRL